MTLEVSDIPHILALALVLPMSDVVEKYEVSPLKMREFLKNHGINLSMYKNEVRKNRCLAILDGGGTIHDAVTELGVETGTLYGLIKGVVRKKQFKNLFCVMKRHDHFAVKKDNKRCTNESIGVRNNFISASAAQKICDELNTNNQ